MSNAVHDIIDYKFSVSKIYPSIEIKPRTPASDLPRKTVRWAATCLHKFVVILCGRAVPPLEVVVETHGVICIKQRLTKYLQGYATSDGKCDVRLAFMMNGFRAGL